MNRRNALGIAVLVSIFSLASSSLAQEAPYTEGSVWAISLIRVKTGMFDDYVKTLNDQTKKVYEQAKKEGLVLSYKVISAPAANRDDWNLMLMVEFKNMAALDETDAKFRAINLKLFSQEQQKKQVQARAEIREIIGDKLGRELILK